MKENHSYQQQAGNTDEYILYTSATNISNIMAFNSTNKKLAKFVFF